MTGNQKTAVERLRNLADQVEGGAFGEGDDLDCDALWDELVDLHTDLD